MSLDHIITGKILYMFFYGVEDEARLERGASRLSGIASRRIFPGIESDRSPGKVLRGVENCSEFLHGGKLRFEARRWAIAGLSLESPRLTAGCSVPLSSHVIITHFPEIGVCSVALGISFEGLETADVIRLRQAQYSNAAFRVVAGPRCNILVPMGGARMSVGGLCAIAASSIGLDSEGSEGCCILEVNAIDGCERSGELDGERRSALYGAFTGDEGWPFVPREEADRVFREAWTTRDFVLAGAQGKSILLVNLSGGWRHREYVEWERRFSVSAGKTLPAYIAERPETAGAEHGLLFETEAAMAARVAVDRLLAGISKNRPAASRSMWSGLKSLREERGRLSSALAEFGERDMDTLDKLGGLVSREVGLDASLESARGVLASTDAYLDVRYRRRSNMLMGFLAGASAAGAVAAVKQLITTVCGTG